MDINGSQFTVNQTGHQGNIAESKLLADHKLVSAKAGQIDYQRRRPLHWNNVGAIIDDPMQSRDHQLEPHSNEETEPLVLSHFKARHKTINKTLNKATNKTINT
jgi:hypothetical protein